MQSRAPGAPAWTGAGGLHRHHRRSWRRRNRLAGAARSRTVSRPPIRISTSALSGSGMSGGRPDSSRSWSSAAISRATRLSCGRWSASGPAGAWSRVSFCGTPRQFRHRRSGAMTSRPASRPADLRAILRHMAEPVSTRSRCTISRGSGDGVRNPMLLLPHQDAPDKSYSVTLNGTGEEIIARRFNSDTRRKLRRKERHLAQLARLSLCARDLPEEVDRCVSRIPRSRRRRVSPRAASAMPLTSRAWRISCAPPAPRPRRPAAR